MSSSEEIKVSKLDDLNVEKNTYVITSKDIADEYEIIDDYIDVISTASTIKSFDPNIMIIISEEIPAYFADQKSIEDVAGIITKRAQTVVDERNT